MRGGGQGQDAGRRRGVPARGTEEAAARPKGDAEAQAEAKPKPAPVPKGEAADPANPLAGVKPGKNGAIPESEIDPSVSPLPPSLWRKPGEEDKE